MIKVILLLSLALILGAEDTTSAHSPCEIVINEYSPSSPSFLEVAKVCPPNKKENDQVSLTGYYVAIISIDDLVLHHFKGLEKVKLTRADQLPLVNLAQTGKREKNGIIPNKAVLRSNEDAAEPTGAPLPAGSTIRSDQQTTVKGPFHGSPTIPPVRNGIVSYPAQPHLVGQGPITPTAGTLSITPKNSERDKSSGGTVGGPGVAGKPKSTHVNNFQASSIRADGVRTPTGTPTRIPQSKPAASKRPGELPSHQTEKKNRRTKRAVSPQGHQKHVCGLVDAELPSLPLNQVKSYAVTLLYLPYNKRSALWDRYAVGQPLKEFTKKEFRDYTRDVLFVTSADDTESHLNVFDVIPSSVDPIFFQMDETETEYSFSKCGKTASAYMAHEFVKSERTRGSKNDCRNYEEPHPFSFRGKTLKSQSQELIVNVATNLEQMIQDGDWKTMSAKDLAAKILNLSRSTVNRIMSRYERGEILSDGKKPCRDSPVTVLDQTKQNILYQIITGYYQKNIVPRFANILKDFVAAVRLKELEALEAVGTTEGSPTESSEATQMHHEETDSDNLDLEGEQVSSDLYHCSARSFTKILSKYGYKYGKITGNDAQIFRPANIKWREKYLDAIKKYDSDPSWRVIYQDETWIDPHQRAQRGWIMKQYDTFEQRRAFAFQDDKTSRGNRLIILAAGGTDGFIHGATEVYPVSVSKKKACKKGQGCTPAEEEDYHCNVDGDKFLKWMEKLFKLLSDKRTVIVMDNCPFHKVLAVPKESDLKETIRSWLEAKKLEKFVIPEDVSPSTKLTKKQLMAVIERLTNDDDGEPQIPKTKVDQLAKKYGHRILKMPPYNPDLNPIEFVWSDIKREVREKNTLQTVTQALSLARHELRTYTADQWQKHIQHVKKTEEQYRVGDRVFQASSLSAADETNAIPLTSDDLTVIQGEVGGPTDMECNEEQLVSV